MSKSEWSLPRLMQALHERVEQDLKTTREALAHPSAKGDSSEAVWTTLFTKYLPQRYAAAKATIVDSNGQFSDQIDIVLFDRQYTPLIFEHQNQIVVPAEAVYALFEAKQDIRPRYVRYAQQKVATVRRLHRTSVPVQTIGGPRTATPQPILAGFLAFENTWKTADIGKYLRPYSPPTRRKAGSISAASLPMAPSVARGQPAFPRPHMTKRLRAFSSNSSPGYKE